VRKLLALLLITGLGVLGCADTKSPTPAKNAGTPAVGTTTKPSGPPPHYDQGGMKDKDTGAANKDKATGAAKDKDTAAAKDKETKKDK
jgi:hypothetical protein